MSSASSEPYTFDRVVRMVLTTLGILGTLWLLHRVRDVIWPLFAAILAAYLLDPLVTRVQGKVTHRGAAVLLTLSGLGIGLAGLGVGLWPLLSHELGEALRIVAELFEEDSPLRTRLAQGLESESVARIWDYLLSDAAREATANPELQSWIVSGVGKVLPQVGDVFSGAWSVLGLGLRGLLAVVYLVFLLIDFRRFSSRWPSYLPESMREQAQFLFDAFNDALATYFRGQFVVASTVGLFFALGFWAIGLHAGVLMGLGMGMLNMVPYLQVAGLLPASFLAVVTALEKGESVWVYLGAVLLVVAVVQGIQDTIITPRVMGSRTGLRPVVILFSVVFWGKLFGFLGVLLAIPLTCMGLVAWQRWLGYDTQPRANPQLSM